METSMPPRRPGRAGRMMCQPCRTRKNGEPCTCVAGNLSLACEPCAKRGYSAFECGPKSWPANSKRNLQARAFELPQGSEERPWVQLYGTDATESSVSVALDVPDGTSSDSAISSLAPLASTVESFHMRLATDEVIDPTIPYGEGPCLHPTKTGYQDGSEFATIHSTFNRLTSPKIAESIVNHLQLYSQRALETMKDFRPFVLPSLCEAHDCWPVLMWNEGELEALRLFHVDEDGSTFCNFLTHYASGKRTDGNGKDWMSSAIYWSVSDLRVLRSLFVASQHLTWLGHVTPIESNTEWSAYQDQDVKEGTKAIFSRMLGIRDTITILEGMMSYFEENSQKTCLTFENGEQKVIMSGWLDL